MSARWIYFFKDALPDGAEPRAMLGGKGASLAEMTRAQFQVPPGFTIVTAACRWFYEHQEKWPAELIDELVAYMARLEEATGRTFGRGEKRLLVSVRSGAAMSMPGMMDTVLNVGRGNDAWAELKRCIDTVFKSWMSERAVAYRARHRIAGLDGTAVNVQAMFPSEVSGVLFTRDPNDVAADRIVIEASHGLGEAVVSGEVTPDRFLVSRSDFCKYETIKARDTATLNPEQITELCALSLRIEKHFGPPMDLEWGWAEGKFALLQSRPIKGIEQAQAALALRREEAERLRALAGTREKVWVAHNLGETLRNPTPLTWDIIKQFMSGNGGFGRMYRDLGYQPSRGVCEQGFLELIGGAIYADPERAACLFWDGLPMGYDVAELRDNPNAINRAPTKFEPDRVDGGFLWRLPRLMLSMWRSSRGLKRLRAESKKHFDDNVLPPFLEYVRSRRLQDLSKLSTSELLQELDARRVRVLDEFGCESLKPGFAGAAALSELEGFLQQLCGPQAGSQIAASLTTALDGDTTLEQDELLAAVARGEKKMADFIEKNGHRCPGEMELMQPRWREDADYLEGVVTQLRSSKEASLEERHAKRMIDQRNASKSLPGVLERNGGSALQDEIESALRDARALLAYRESGKHFLMQGYELIRLVLIELGRRWELKDDVFFLRLDELAQFESKRDELKAALPARKLRWEAAKKLSMAERIDSRDLASLGLPPKVEAQGGALSGATLSAGVGEGTVRIVFDPSEARDLGTDYILVCPSTDPGWTPLFMRARGLVVERGGVLSHGAIVARDFGIPAVACPGATTLLRAGERVRVDGNAGFILRLEKEAACSKP